MGGFQRRPREEWADLVQAQESSEQTIKAFCELHHLNRHTFQYWRGKFRQEENDSQGFVNLRPPVLAGQSILVRCSSGVEVELPADYTPSLLIELIRGLRC
jgi:transposase-like protein